MLLDLKILLHQLIGLTNESLDLLKLVVLNSAQSQLLSQQ
jgi:hypothetical protein